MKGILKKVFLIMLTLIIFILIFLESFFFNFVYYKGTPNDINWNENEEQNIWFKKGNKVSIKSKDELILYANEFINENSNNWVIVIHGIGSEGKRMSKYGYNFYKNNYNVLILELRGNGISNGEYFTYGYDDKKDVLCWIDYILEKNKESNIVIFGSSMGAATSLLVSSENIPKNVTHIISDSGYSSLQDEFEFYMKERMNIPTFPLLNIFNIITKIKFGYFCNEISPMEAVKSSRIPILFIHGKEDSLVPFYMLDKIYENANCSKQKIEVDNANHMQSIDILGEDIYFKNIFSFIEKY